MKKQTALEWFIEQVCYQLTEGNFYCKASNVNNEIIKAMELEKQQIMESHISAQVQSTLRSPMFDITGKRQKENAEQYYNETYKNE